MMLCPSPFESFTTSCCLGISSLPNIVDHGSSLSTVSAGMCVPAPLIIKPGQLEKISDLHHEFLLFKGHYHWQIKT